MYILYVFICKEINWIFQCSTIYRVAFFAYNSTMLSFALYNTYMHIWNSTHINTHFIQLVPCSMKMKAEKEENFILSIYISELCISVERIFCCEKIRVGLGGSDINKYFENFKRYGKNATRILQRTTFRCPALAKIV